MIRPAPLHLAKEKAIPKRPRGRPRSQPETRPFNPVRALDRGVTLLRALSRDTGMILTDIARMVDLPPSTAHRMLVTLQRQGFAEFSESTQQWSVGLEAFRVGNAYLNNTNLVEVARKTLYRLMEETGETANLGIASHGKVVFISQVETDNPIRAFYRPGTRSHMHASGVGKALLSNLPRYEVESVLEKPGLPEFTPNTRTSWKALHADLEISRNRGWALDDEERYLGMRCIASNVHNSFGEAIAAISVSGPTVRFPVETIHELGPRVRQAAQAVTGMIGGKVPGQAIFQKPQSWKRAGGVEATLESGCLAGGTALVGKNIKPGPDDQGNSGHHGGGGDLIP